LEERNRFSDRLRKKLCEKLKEIQGEIVCARESERGSEREKECVCVCVKEKERERDSEEEMKREMKVKNE